MKKVFFTILLLACAILFAYFFISSIVLIFQYHLWRQAITKICLGSIVLVLYLAIWFMPQKKA